MTEIIVSSVFILLVLIFQIDVITGGG